MFSSKPSLTEKNLPDQLGKVFIVTGSSSGLGKELAKILYQRNSKVYIAVRSEEKAQAAIKEIRDSFPSSKGELHFLHLDLSDLKTIKNSAQEFLKQESRLDVLWNNAGVMMPPEGSKTVQGYELQLGVNTIGTFLFTQFLQPILASTAKNAPKSSVRVAWVSSSAVLFAPKEPINYSNANYEKDEGMWRKYERSKVGVIVLAAEFARRTSSEGIISISVDPGVYMTELQRTSETWRKYLVKIIGGDPKNGAYTELYAGLSPNIVENKDGVWVVPNGKIGSARKDFFDKEVGKRFWEWTEEQVKQYL